MRAIAIIAMMTMMSLSVLAQEPIPDGEAAKKTDGVKSEKPEKDCHGPLYYKLQQQDKEQRDGEAARKTLEVFAGRVGPLLYAAHKDLVDRHHARQAVEYVDCLRRKRQPGYLCAALAHRSLEECVRLPTEELKRVCGQRVTAYQAARNKDSSGCSAVGGEELQQLCGFLARGRLECSKLPEGFVRKACRAVDVVRAGKVPAEMTGGELSTVMWLWAIADGISHPCKRIEKAVEAGECMALMEGEIGHCIASRPLDETIDNDYSCRKMVPFHRIIQKGNKAELLLAVSSAYKGTAQCLVKVEFEQHGVPVFKEFKDISVSGPGFWKEFRIPLNEGKFVGVEVPCKWDQTSSAVSVGDSAAP